MTELNLNPGFFVEFQLSVLDTRYDKKELRDLIHDQMVNLVDENCVLGVQLHPDGYPTKAIIQCIDKKTVENLIFTGIDIDDTHVELSEPGYGAIKVFVHNAPLDFPNASVRKWLERFGELSNFRDELYITGTGVKTAWKTGTRSALVRLHDLEVTVPPHDVLTYGTRKTEISVYHFGQTERYCRFCKRNVPKNHECDRSKSKSCHKCGMDGHLKANCPRNRFCHACKAYGHISRDCPTSSSAPKGDRPISGVVRHEFNNKITTGAKRAADALRSPSNEVPGTPAASEVSVNAEVHFDFTDENGFTLDKTSKKKMIRAKRRDPKHTSTPKEAKDMDAITVESTGCAESSTTASKISPANKKQKRSSGTMSIKKMFNNMLNIKGAEKPEEEEKEYESCEKETISQNPQHMKKTEKSPKPAKKGNKVKVTQEEKKKLEKEEETPTHPEDISKNVINKEVLPEAADSVSELTKEEKKLESSELDASVILTDTDGEEEKDGKQQEEIEETDNGEEEVDSWNEERPKSFISREYETTLKLLEPTDFSTDVHVIAGSNFTGLKLCGDADLKLNQVDLCEPGLTIARAPYKLGDLFEEERNKVELIVVHTGVVDFKDEGGNDPVVIHANYMKMLGTLRHHCTNAQIIASSIILRRGEKYAKVNSELSCFNNLLKKSCEDVPYYHFSDSQGSVTDENGRAKVNMYENYMHLNSAGKRELGKSIVSVLKHAYFQNQVVALPGELANRS